MADKKVKISIVGTSQALKELEALSKTAAKAAASEAKMAKEVERAAKKAADAQVREAKRTALEAERAAKKAADAQTREAQRAATAAAKAAENAAKAASKAEAKHAAEYEAYQRKLKDMAIRGAAERARAEEKSAAARRKETLASLRTAGGIIGAVGSGAVVGGLSAINTARGIAGVNDVGQRIQNANSFKERLVITAGQAGLDEAGQAQVEKNIKGAASASGIMPNDLLSVVETGQAQFNDLKFFSDHLKEIAVMAKATGSDVGEFAKAMGFAKQAFGLTSDETIEAAKLMAAAASKGSIEVKDFARDFAPVMGVFAQTTKMSGMRGLKELLGVSQAAGTLGAGSAETSTMIDRLMAVMQNPEKMAELKKKTGIDVMKGGFTPSQFIDTLAENKRFNKKGVQADIFGGDIRANYAITALLAARKRVLNGEAGAIDTKTIAGDTSHLGFSTAEGVTAAQGQAQIDDIMSRLEKSGVMGMQRSAVEMENDTITHLKEYNDQIMLVVGASNKLEKSFGTLSLWASSIGSAGLGGTLGGAATTALMNRMAGGGGGGGLPGADAGGGSGVIGKLGKALAVIGAAEAGYEAGKVLDGVIGSGIGWLTGDKKDQKLSDYIGQGLSAHVDNHRDAILNDGRGGDIPVPGQVDVKTDVTIHDNRTEVKTTTNARGNGVRAWGSGPMLDGYAL